MKKIVCILCLFIFSYILGGIALAENSVEKKVIVKQLILKKRELEKNVSKGKVYVQALDAYFEKYKDDREKINDLITKVSAAKTKLGNSKKEQEIKLLIEYIEYKFQLALLTLPKAEIVIENSKDILNLSGDEMMEYVEGLEINELQDLVEDLYDNKRNIYDEIIELYESQVPLARDTSRIADLMALQSGVEQIYQDSSEYPTQENFTQLVSEYLGKIPKDPLAGYSLNNCDFGYKYEVGPFIGIENQQYRISTCFESNEYTNKKALNEFDYGDDDLRYEAGRWIEDTDSKETFYINNITRWERYTASSTSKTKNINSYNDESKREIFHYMIAQKYLESHPEILEEYSRDSMNSKVSSNIQILISAIEERLVDGISIDKIIISEGKKYHSSISNIYSGNINYEQLGLDKYNFGSPGEKYDYQFAYNTDLRGNRFYQVLGYKKISENRYEAVIKGFYIQIDSGDPVGLHKNPVTGEYLKNGDIISISN